MSDSNPQPSAHLFIKDVYDPCEMTELVCSNLVSKNKLPRIYIQHNIFKSEEYQRTLEWPPKTPQKCWHDTHFFTTPPVCIPDYYHPTKNYFVVYGVFCSLNCAKAYIDSRVHYNSSKKKALLHSMAHKVYGYIGPIHAAPPCEALKDFGGYLTIEEFRNQCKNLVTNVTQYPFISKGALIEARAFDDYTKTNDTKESATDNMTTSLDAIKVFHDQMDNDQWQLRNLNTTEHTSKTNSDKTRISQTRSLYSEYLESKQSSKTNVAPEPDKKQDKQDPTQPANQRGRKRRKVSTTDQQPNSISPATKKPVENALSRFIRVRTKN